MTILNKYHHSLIVIIIVSTFYIHRYDLHDLKKIISNTTLDQRYQVCKYETEICL